MSEKIIRRVANKYRQWMIEEAAKPIQTDSIINRLEDIILKSQEIRKWLYKFQKGMQPRIQHDKHSLETYLGIVCRGPYEDILKNMLPDLVSEVSNEVEYTKVSIANLSNLTHNKIIPLSLKDAINEIRIIFEAWPDVRYEKGYLSVLIKSVTLEDENEEIDLGDFYILIDPSSPLKSLRIESVNHIISENDYCHPHVASGILCTGDGQGVIQEAIYQGRLEDFFRIVEAILRTYNASSPHEPLQEWYDPQHEGQCYCEKCEEWRSEDNSWFCEQCEESYCDTCDDFGSCCRDCQEWRCKHCMSNCESCDEPKCESCIAECDKCENAMCEECLGTCNGCGDPCCKECTISCACCGDDTCRSCEIECSHCNNTNCQECVYEECAICSDMICKDCETVCDTCDKIICISCRNNKCDDCGQRICELCISNHECLLSEKKSSIQSSQQS